MATFDQFETIEDLHGGAHATVSKARGRRGGDTEEFAIKSCRPDAGEETAAILAEFESVFEELRALEKAGAPHWVRVVAGKVREDEAYWVSHLFPRSLQTVLERRPLLLPEDIHWVAAEIAAGLAEIETLRQRPHGNLKASNIFIEGEGRLQSQKVYLSDPRAPARLESEDRTADFYELGRLIVLLVRRRSDEGRKLAWPIEEGNEWKRFGRQATAWRELCNALLNPNPDPADLDWRKVQARLAEFAPKEKRSWPMATALAAVPVLAIGGFLGYLRFQDYTKLSVGLQPWAQKLGNIPKDETAVPPEWAKLCEAYNEWLGGFEPKLPEKTTTTSLQWPAELNEGFTNVLVRARDNYKTLDPLKLAKIDPKDPDLVGSVLELAHPSDEVAHILKNGVVAEKIRKVTAAVQQAAQALADWPVRRKLDTTRQHFVQLGWTGPAAQLQRWYERSGPAAQSDGSLKDLQAGINDLLTNAPEATRAETLWHEIETRAATLANGDPAMRDVLAYQRTRVAGATDLHALNVALADANQDLADWIGLIQTPAGQPRIDRARFARESSFSNFRGALTPDVVTQWKNALKEFEYLPDAENPRRKPDWTAQLRSVDDALGQLRQAERDAPPNVAAGAAVSTGLQQSRDEAKRLIDEMTATRVIRKDAAAATDAAQALVTRLKSLGETVLAAIGQLKPNAGPWLAEKGAQLIGTPGSELQREWIRRRDQLLAGANADALSRNATEFRALAQRQTALEEFFKVLAGPRGVAAFPAFDPAGLSPDFAAPLRTWSEARTRRATTEWFGAIAWNGPVPATTGEAFVSGDAARRVTDRLAADFRDARDLANDFSAVDDRLVQGFGLEDSAVGALTKWSQHPLISELGSVGPVQSLLGARGTLEGLRTDEKRDEIAKLAGSAPNLGIALAAWHRLGALTAPWPTPAELDEEKRLASALDQRIGQSVRDTTRRDALKAELATEEPRRWRVAKAAAKEDTVLVQVLSRHDDFGVAAAQLSPDEKFNVELQRLKRVDWRNVGEGNVVTQRNQEVGALRNVFGGAVPPEVGTWLQTLLDLVLTDEGGKSDLRKLGPGAASWTGESSPDSRQVVFRRTVNGQAQQLGFVLVDTEGVAPFYLGTTELSAGLLIDLAADPAINTRLQTWLREVAGDRPLDDPRNGPRVWRLDAQHRLQRNDGWTGVALPAWPKPLYPADVVAGAPGRESPVQYLPPAAALYLAQEVLGSRLPTSEEWQAVISSGLAEKSAGPHGPNLRDATWKKERDYLMQVRELEVLPIDQDIFWPAGVAAPKQGRQALPKTEQDDGVLWFTAAGNDHPEVLQNVLGNVAEYLFDDTSKQFYVAGGSALSPPEVDPVKPYPVEARLAANGFSDVGVRLAFSASGGLAGRIRLQQLIRQRPFLRP